MSDLPERLRALAEHITCWDHPITARQDCLDAAREIERLRAIIDSLAVAELLKYPGPLGVTYFVDTLEIRDANGSIIANPAELVRACLNLCREAAKEAT